MNKDKNRVEEAEAFLSADAFEQLERDFHEVLEELVGDKSLEHFRVEYEKLHRALKRSHESEKRLIKKCRELNGEIVQNAVKVQTALKLSQEDQQRISALKKEIERAWRMVETSHEKEQRANETITTLKSEADNLTRIVEQGWFPWCGVFEGRAQLDSEQNARLIMIGSSHHFTAHRRWKIYQSGEHSEYASPAKARLDQAPRPAAKSNHAACGCKSRVSRENTESNLGTAGTRERSPETTSRACGSKSKIRRGGHPQSTHI